MTFMTLNDPSLGPPHIDHPNIKPYLPVKEGILTTKTWQPDFIRHGGETTCSRSPWSIDWETSCQGSHQTHRFWALPKEMQIYLKTRWPTYNSECSLVLGCCNHYQTTMEAIIQIMHAWDLFYHLHPFALSALKIRTRMTQMYQHIATYAILKFSHLLRFTTKKVQTYR